MFDFGATLERHLIRTAHRVFSEEVAFHRLAVQNFPLCSIFYLKFVFFLVIPIFACYTRHCVAKKFTHWQNRNENYSRCLSDYFFVLLCIFSQPITSTQLASASILLEMSSWTFKRKIITWGPAGYDSYGSIIWVSSCTQKLKLVCKNY